MRVDIDVLVAIAMAVGLVGTVVPFLPGLPVIMVAAFVWVVAGGADTGQWVIFGIVGLVAGAGMIVGSLLPARRAASAGASRWALVSGAVGAVVGAIVIPVVGILIGWPVGVLLAEWLRTREFHRAWASTRATIVGVLHGAAVQFGAGVVAVSVWGVAAWRW